MQLILLIAEIDAADAGEAQTKLDAFREKARPWRKGLTITRAIPAEVARFDLSAEFFIPTINGKLE
jgi:hypothetical protein